MLELADKQASDTCVFNMRVQVPSPAPKKSYHFDTTFFIQATGLVWHHALACMESPPAYGVTGGVLSSVLIPYNASHWFHTVYWQIPYTALPWSSSGWTKCSVWAFCFYMAFSTSVLTAVYAVKDSWHEFWGLGSDDTCIKTSTRPAVTLKSYTYFCGRI